MLVIKSKSRIVVLFFIRMGEKKMEMLVFQIFTAGLGDGGVFFFFREKYKPI